jgi:hypothetical protein
MTNQNLGFFDYIKAAFHWKIFINGLGHLALNKFALFAFGVFGLVNPGFWLVGAAFEIGYLLSLSGSERFQKLVQGTLLISEKQVSRERMNQIYSRLDDGGKRRFQKLQGICNQILQTADRGSGPIGGSDLQQGGLGQLSWIFLKLLDSEQKIGQIIKQTSLADLEQDIAASKQKITKEPDNSALARSLKGTLEIQEKRLDNLQKSRENLKVIEAELDRIEKQASLISEELSMSSDPESLSMRLDGITRSLQGTSKWMADNDALFSQIEDPAVTPEIPATPLQTKE